MSVRSEQRTRLLAEGLRGKDEALRRGFSKGGTRMWVLIVFISLAQTALAAIPGYTSEGACTQAGKEFLARSADKGALNREFVCIPGPR